MNKLRQLYLPHLRLVVTFAVDLLTISELLIPKYSPAFLLGIFSSWILPQRRIVTAYYVGEERQSVWRRLFEPPSPSRTPHVVAASLLGMTAVLTVSLATVTIHPSNLFLIPAYGVFLLIVLVNRQRRLSLAS